MECAEEVKKKINKDARETWRARCEDGCFVKTHTLTADLMTQVFLSHARKIHVCGSAECAQVWCGVHSFCEVFSSFVDLLTLLDHSKI